jgi:N-acetylglutamate synthase-like GNAT family acetyltransferase
MSQDTRFALPPGTTIRNDLKPGDVGYVTYLHGVLYAQEQGWDHTFEAYVAGPLAEFAKSNAVVRNDRERIWIVEKEGVVAGSIGIVDAASDIAQLRWLLLHPELRGYGLGWYLVREAVGFCREQSYKRVFLWTVSALVEAARLYISAGFRVTEETTRVRWSCCVTEQRYDLDL